MNNLVSLAEIAAMFDVTYKQAWTWHDRRARNGFPEAVDIGSSGKGRAHMKATPLWSSSAVLDWHRSYVPSKGGSPLHRKNLVSSI